MTMKIDIVLQCGACDDRQDAFAIVAVRTPAAIIVAELPPGWIETNGYEHYCPEEACQQHAQDLLAPNESVRQRARLSKDDDHYLFACERCGRDNVPAPEDPNEKDALVCVECLAKPEPAPREGESGLTVEKMRERLDALDEKAPGGDAMQYLMKSERERALDAAAYFDERLILQGVNEKMRAALLEAASAYTADDRERMRLILCDQNASSLAYSLRQQQRDREAKIATDISGAEEIWHKEVLKSLADDLQEKAHACEGNIDGGVGRMTESWYQGRAKALREAEESVRARADMTKTKG